MEVDLAWEFPLEPGLLYLNHAAVSPWPRRVADAVHAFAHENLCQGSRDYPRWMRREQHLREQGRALVNAASADDIALLKNTSEALSVVAHGLAWRPGDNVVITDQEFPSNRIVWESLRPQGVAVRAAALDAEPEAAIIAAMDAQTRLVSVSSVQYGTGLRLDLARLGEACRAHGALFCVDAIQSLGAVPMDAPAVGADFVMADGHKWLLGPEGLALFYCAPAAREQLILRQFGWHMVAEPGDFDRLDWSPAASARRFECGSPNMLGIHALSAALNLIEDVGVERIHQALIDKTDYLIERIVAAGCELLSPTDPARRAGIVTFRRPGEDPAALHQRLTEAGVQCAQRAGGVRLSPHFYTPEAVLERVAALL